MLLFCSDADVVDGGVGVVDDADVDGGVGVVDDADVVVGGGVAVVVDAVGCCWCGWWR